MSEIYPEVQGFIDHSRQVLDSRSGSAYLFETNIDDGPYPTDTMRDQAIDGLAYLLDIDPIYLNSSLFNSVAFVDGLRLDENIQKQLGREGDTQNQTTDAHIMIYPVLSNIGFRKNDLGEPTLVRGKTLLVRDVQTAYEKPIADESDRTERIIQRFTELGYHTSPDAAKLNDRDFEAEAARTAQLVIEALGHNPNEVLAAQQDPNTEAGQIINAKFIAALANYFKVPSLRAILKKNSLLFGPNDENKLVVQAHEAEAMGIRIPGGDTLATPGYWTGLEINTPDGKRYKFTQTDVPVKRLLPDGSMVNAWVRLNKIELLK